MTEMAEDEIKIPEAGTAGKDVTGKPPLDSFSPSTQTGGNSSPAPSSYVADKNLSGAIPVTPAKPLITPMPATVPTPPPAVIPVTQPTSVSALNLEASEQSPFFGKIAPQKPSIPLNVVTSPVPTSLVQAIPNAPAITPPPVVQVGSPASAWSPSKTATVPEKNARAEDKLHSGNIISLLEEQAQRQSGVPPQPVSGMKYGQTPVQRSIREIGLQPRPIETPSAKEAGIAPQKNDGLPRIRTYAADMSEEIRKRGETLATIISAERNKMGRGPVGDETQTKTEITAQEKTRNTLLSFGALFLIFVAVIGLIIAFFLTRPQQTMPERVSVIPVNYAELVTPTAPDKTITTLSDLRLDTDLRLGEMKEFILTENGVPLSAESTLLRFGAPAALARNANSIMVGIHAFDRNQPFILVSIAAYDRTFEGMLAWEETIGDDLGTFFAPNKTAKTLVSGTAPSLNFRDRVYQNIDIRESNAEWKIIYAFPRRDLLLITTNESTLREVVTRLTLQSGN